MTDLPDRRLHPVLYERWFWRLYLIGSVVFALTIARHVLSHGRFWFWFIVTMFCAIAGNITMEYQHRKHRQG